MPDVADRSEDAQWRCEGETLSNPRRTCIAMNDIHQSFATRGLVRPQQGRILGGVIAGLAQRFGIGAWTARLLCVLVLMVIPGSRVARRRSRRGSAP